MGAVVNAIPGEVHLVTGDTHLYVNHTDQAKEQISREPFPLPKYTVEGWGANSPGDVTVGMVDYVAHPHIKGDVAV